MDSVFERSMPSDLIRGWMPVRVKSDGTTHAAHTPLSSPGLTGRPSTPPPIMLIADFPAYWIPAFAGMTGGGRAPK